MTKRHPANGQSGGRGADVWVILASPQVDWLRRNVNGSLTSMSVDGEVVRISHLPASEQTALIEDVELPEDIA